MKRINGNIFKRAVSLLLLFSLVVVFAFVLINDTSAAETKSGLKVNATSNYFPAAYTTVDGGEEYVTVTYFMNSPKDVLNVQWTLTYDPAYLEFAEADNMNAANRSNLMPMVDDLVWNADSKNYIKANASALELYKFAGKGLVPFATVTFKVIGSGETTVDLNVEVLTLSLPDSETQMTDSGQEEPVIDKGVVNEAKVHTGRETSVYEGLYNPDYNAKVSNEEDIISALNNGVYMIKLIEDITLSDTLDLSDKIITLDLNGYVLTGNIKLADNSGTSKSTLYLIDSSTASDGVLDGKIDLTRSCLYANGGTVTGLVSMNDSASKIFCTNDTPTVFNGNVGNFGEIHGGIFYGDINKSCIKEKYITFMNGEDTYAYEVVSSDNNTVAPAKPDQAKYGYQNFDGWYNDEAAYAFGSSLSEDITLTAKFSNPETFNITYDLDGGTANNPISYNVESDTITLSNPTKTGYTFTGWSGTDLTGNDNVTVTIPKGSMGSRSYAAHFSPNSYTVSFDTTGGSTISDKTGIMWSDKVLDGVISPTKDSWEFTGWKYADTAVNADTKYSDLVTDDKITGITLVAQWKDINAPTGEISIGAKKWTELSNDITFSQFFKDTQEVTITAVDSSGESVTIEYLLSNKVLTDSELDKETFIGYTEPFSINQDNKYVIYAKLTDASGNVTYISSEGIVLDATVPVISGIENGKTYCEAQRVTITEEYIKSVTVNGTEVTLNENNQFTLNPAEGKQTIVVTDEAGNVSAEMIVTVNNGHTDVNKDHACDYGCSVAIGEHTDTNQDHVCDYGCSVAIGEHRDTNKDHACDYGCSVAIGEHTDTNQDHVCDYGCSVAIGEHTDTNKDHACDYGCSVAIGEHTDTNKDHACDYGCSVAIGEHTDTNQDHVCDYGCSVAIGEHTDTNKDHACDYGCSVAIGEHTDTNQDHVCDYGCSVAIGEHTDTNKDHACDYGCSVAIGEHTDTNQDHVCDYGCAVAIGEHIDTNKDHVCDYGCSVAIGEHRDTNKDHACDYGCSVAIGEHKDANQDHVCDYGCEVAIGEHIDTNQDHVCDYGCSVAIGEHTDTNQDHVCDYGCSVAIGEHTDTNKDHVCDYGCSVAIGEHTDTNKDHACDYGCSVAIGEHVDTNKDHVCDYGCPVAIGEHIDANQDHVCDYGCTVAIGEHKDANQDHVCDYGCSVAIGEHTDTNKDHACDYGCSVAIGEHTDANKDHICDYGCPVAIGEHIDANKDHVCDYGCTEKIGEHTGGEATCTELAICDICGVPYGELDSSNHNLERISAKDATATENGNIEYWHCLICSKYFSDKDGKNSIELNDTVLEKLQPEIIDGTGQSVTQGEKKSLIFRSNAAFVDFIRVEIDGNTLDENNYTAKEGSTIVTLNADYTATLSVGEHTIGIVSESGTAATTFNVNVKKVEDNDTNSPDTEDNDTNSPNAGDNNTNSPNAGDNNTNSPNTGDNNTNSPNTGDNNINSPNTEGNNVNSTEVEENHIKSPGTGDNHHIVVWFALMLMGGCLLIVTVIKGISIEKRRKH